MTLAIDWSLRSVFVALILAGPVVFIPWAAEDVFVWPRVVVIGGMALVAVVGLTARAVWLAGPPVAPSKPVDIALLVLLGSGATSWMLSVDPRLSLAGEPLQYRGLAATLVIPVFLGLGRYVGSSGRWESLLGKPAIIAGGVVAGFAILQQSGLDPWWNELPQGRSFSTLGQPNVLGATTLILGLIAFMSIPLLGARWRGVGWAVVALVPMAVIASGSRGAMLAGLGAAAVIGWEVRRQVTIRGLLIVVGVAVVAFVAISPLRSATTNAIDRIAATTDTEVGGSVQMRMDLWVVAVEMIERRPVFGWGQDTYATVFPLVDDDVLNAESRDALDVFRPESPHNLTLELTQGSGFVGLAAYVALVAASVLIVFRDDGNTRLRTMVFAVAAAYLVSAQFMTSEWAGSSLFWLVLGVGIGAAAPSAIDARHDTAGPHTDARLPKYDSMDQL